MTVPTTLQGQRCACCEGSIQGSAPVWIERDDGSIRRTSMPTADEHRPVRRIWHLGCLFPKASDR